MLKFFRKIRQKLLADLPASKAGNRVTRYLVYALGEILLVVIGILIALQINTWNEERKISKERNQFMQSIKEDLIADTLSLQETLGQWNIQLAELNAFKQQVNTTRNYDSIIILARYELPPVFSIFFRFQ
jgi:hypothetical protein